ncbi:hypothetical protein [Streptomyces sp. NPDC058011]|uniref:hypothetical protein n=1 Tax=Streptomyces sp. NPDC058011 TaxID=3346305 RepID=UPI0036EF8C0A
MPLLELSDQARRSDGYAAFVCDRLTKELQNPLTEPSSPKICGSPEPPGGYSALYA